MSLGTETTLRATLDGIGDMAVAVSGGVDSVTLATRAHRLGVSLGSDRTDGARQFAGGTGRSHHAGPSIWRMKKDGR